MVNGAVYTQLVIFHMIVDEGSISGAARRLELTAAAVSKSLKQLEQYIGAPLYRRTTRRIELTEMGENLRKETQEKILALQTSFNQVKDLNAMPNGVVRITLAKITYHLLLKPIFADFCRLYPDIELEISINDGTVDILAEGFDLGIRLGDVIQEGMVARRLTKPLLEKLYVSPKYVAQYGLPEKIEELSEHKLIGYRFVTSRRILPLVLNHQGEQFSVSMQSNIVVDDIEVMADAVGAGLGIGRIFETELDLIPMKEQLIPVLEAYWHTYPPAYLYYMRNSQMARRVQVFIDFLLAHIKLD